jgi:alkanesulfonate monooxygenase SsuD/methylene tetrahydromethanopterin reductase-like flavin-dependent oxidoreductase (luciferase family)
MAFFGMRFDFRVPAFAPGTVSERYQAALDMAQWADEVGFGFVNLSEHHGCDDGYLPSPLPVAAAMAARTKDLRITIGAMVPSFHDPLRLAEDIAVVDLLSGGRVAVTLTNGYVASEFDMYGVALSERPRRTTEAVEVLRKAWTGEPFEHRGRTVQVRPTPATPGGPPIQLGGSTEAAARRAARIADGFMPSTPEIFEFYRDELRLLGKPDPGPYPGADTGVVHLAEDVDAAWEELAPYAMHEVNAYGKWAADAGTFTAGGYDTYDDPDELRASGRYRVLTPEQFVEELGAAGPFAFAMFHPLVGGLPPEAGWRSLHLLQHEVLPRL